LDGLIHDCRPAFGGDSSFQRGRRHLLSQLASFGRRTISGLLRCQNRHQQDWSADYRFYSRDRFDEGQLFAAVRRAVEATLKPAQPLVAAMDDSLLRKTGRKIHGVRYQRDPMSPPFNVNFVRGLRVLQISAAIPRGNGAARQVPIDFQHAVLPPKPPRKATAEELKAYEKLRAQRNINRVGRERLAVLRQQMDQDGSAARPLIVSIDGRFTNSTVLEKIPERTTLIGRIRQDAVAYHQPAQQPALGRKRKYGLPAPTPLALLQDEATPGQSVAAFASGKTHLFQVKQMGPVLLRMNKGAAPVRIVVIKALGYRLKKGGKLLYRDPAFLLCTDPNLKLEDLLQHYLWRWDIEVNFRDEKTILGVGQAQVRTEHSNQNAPALAVAAYSLLLLASIKTYGKTGAPDRIHAPKWYKRKPGQRATTNELLNQLRFELWADSLSVKHFSDFSTRTSPDQNPEKLTLPLANAAFLSLQ
jgi:hypothetical protein